MNSAGSRRPCIFIVDDEPTNIQILIGLLQADYEIKAATHGEAALKVCEQNPNIDLILLDVMMPEVDGYEVCQKIRSAPASRNIPIIFLTARSQVEDIVRGFELGASDYVIKPFQAAELLARVRTHLLIRSQQIEIAEKNAELRGMLQIVCHDVANHFCIVHFCLQLAEEEPATIEKNLKRMTAAVRNGIGLTSLVRDLRRVDEKGISLVPVSLASTIDETLLLADDRINAKQITVTKNVPDLQVIAEQCALTNSVFGNVISNAIKFSNPGSAIDIAAYSDNGMVCVTIRDHGIGMPPAVMESLFDVTRSVTRKGTAGESGTGFGMPLMRRFVTLFGGYVEVATWEGATHLDDHGSEFKIWLKLAT